jgi:hypothetical protein
MSFLLCRLNLDFLRVHQLLNSSSAADFHGNDKKMDLSLIRLSGFSGPALA